MIVIHKWNITGFLITLILIIHWINEVSIGISIGYIINLYQKRLLLIILVSTLAIVIYHHPAQALVQIYIIANTTGCKKGTKTVSYLLLHLFLIYQVIHLIVAWNWSTIIVTAKVSDILFMFIYFDSNVQRPGTSATFKKIKAKIKLKNRLYKELRKNGRNIFVY